MECDICVNIALEKARSSRKLRKVILDCWQREYDKRPYDHILFHGKVFEKKFHRNMTADDFLTILTFLDERTIKHFEFLHCTVPDIHIQHFLKCINNLVSVNFSHSNVPMQMFQYLAAEAGNLTLKTLLMCGNIIDEPKSECLRTFLLKTETLFYFDISNCCINHITLAIIADGILHCKNLKSIDLSEILPHHPQHLIDTFKVSLILSILIWSGHLLQVHFRKTWIDGSGIAMMCENISVSCLSILDIGSNCIGPDGTDTLFKALKQSNVSALIMPFNRIGDTGGNIIAENLCYTKLKHLDISCNEISAKTLELILTNLTKCKPTLNISGNVFNSQTIGSVLHILIINNILNPAGLDVTTNYFDDTDEYQIFPIENQILNYFQEFPKLSNYCAKHKINPKTMIWYKKNLRHVVG